MKQITILPTVWPLKFKMVRKRRKIKLRIALAISLFFILSSCAPIATPAPTLEQPPTIDPSPSLQPEVFPTAVTPQTESILEDFDPFVDSGITITHIPPLIAKAEEDVQLDFIIDCDQPGDARVRCKPDTALFAAHGPEPDFEPKTLTKEIRDSLEIWTITLPAADSNGQALQYYLEITDEGAMAQSRYPLVGAIELVVAPTFMMIDLPPGEPPLREGEQILHASWGSGLEQVGLSEKEGRAPLGPSAFDMSPDGKIAVLDEVNQRVSVFDLQANETTTYPVELKGGGDIAFANADEIMILDLVGENGTPQLYMIDTTDNKIDHLGSVFTSSSADLISDAMILDANLGRVINPINSSGGIKSGEDQIQDYALAETLARWQTDYRSLFADTQEGLIFDIRSTAPLGAIGYFSKTSDGYIVVFEGEFLRILWINQVGQILNDCRVTNQQEAPINHYGRFTVDQNESLYYLNTTPNGMRIRRIDRQQSGVEGGL